MTEITEARALISDLGGVFVEPSYDVIFKEMVKYSCHDVSALKEAWSGVAKDKLNEKFDKEEISPEEYYRCVCEVLWVDVRKFKFGLFRRLFIDCILELKHATRFLPKLRDNFEVMIMLTNINVVHNETLRGRFPHIFEPFDHVIASCEEGMRKPEPEIYQRTISCLRSYGISAEEAVFVDDLQVNCRAALNAGIGKAIVFDHRTFELVA